MTKPTITDEDRAAAASRYFAWCSGNETITNRMLVGQADDHSMVQAFARHRQAAFNAGLERAAVIASKEAQGWLNIGTSKAASNMTAAKYKARHQAGGEIVAKIRAEKEKPQ